MTTAHISSDPESRFHRNISAWRAAQGKYVIKCDDCKQNIRRTDNLAESAAGGRCDHCRTSGVED